MLTRTKGCVNQERRVCQPGEKGVLTRREGCINQESRVC